MRGAHVYVTFARMAGVVVDVEYPYPDDPDTELFEVELDDGRTVHALLSQLSW